MIKILSCFLATTLLFTVSFYSLSFTTTSGSSVPISSFEGKKILLVNIATNSQYVTQLQGLQQLKQQFGDSLIIIAFPSNSFGNEPRSDSAIRSFCETNYSVSFIIAQKASVSGPMIQPIYSWLTQQSQNGSLNSIVKSDFQKYLVNGSGEIIGIYSCLVEPTSQKIISAINSN